MLLCYSWYFKTSKLLCPYSLALFFNNIKCLWSDFSL